MCVAGFTTEAEKVDTASVPADQGLTEWRIPETVSEIHAKPLTPDFPRSHRLDIDKQVV